MERSQEPEPEPIAGIGAGQDWTDSTTLVVTTVYLLQCCFIIMWGLSLCEGSAFQ